MWSLILPLPTILSFKFNILKIIICNHWDTSKISISFQLLLQTLIQILKKKKKKLRLFWATILSLSPTIPQFLHSSFSAWILYLETRCSLLCSYLISYKHLAQLITLFFLQHFSSWLHWLFPLLFLQLH